MSNLFMVPKLLALRMRVSVTWGTEELVLDLHALLVVIFLVVIVVILVMICCLFHYLKAFNKKNLEDRMEIANEILRHNKQLGAPMGVELGWKKFVISTPGIPKTGDGIEVHPKANSIPSTINPECEKEEDESKNPGNHCEKRDESRENDSKEPPILSS